MRAVVVFFFVAWLASAVAGCASKAGAVAGADPACTADAIPLAMCDPSACDALNTCVCADDGKSASCKRTCSSQSDCPFDYFCNDASPKTYCQSMTFPGGSPIVKRDRGQWGYACDPQKGEAGNSDCDTAQGFACWGRNPTDASAFCTTIGQCSQNSDCPGGWWCATTNVQPNVTTSKLELDANAVRPVCLPRAYCSPCEQDHDCPVTPDGVAQHCITDDAGHGFCTTECETANCAPDARCRADDVANVKVCYPNAGVCVGDGSFCSPCRSHADCATANEGGFCLESSFSHEHFCSARDTTTCVAGQKPTGCPALPQGVKNKSVECAPTGDPLEPPGQCIPMVLDHGTPAYEGCWVPNW
jgi:hypothetical protein